MEKTQISHGPLKHWKRSFQPFRKHPESNFKSNGQINILFLPSRKFRFLESDWETFSSASNPNEDSAFRPRRFTMIRNCLRHRHILHFTRGSGRTSKHMRSFISANTETWNGFREEALPWGERISPSRFWVQSRISTPSSSMIPERAPRPNAEPLQSLSII